MTDSMNFITGSTGAVALSPGDDAPTPWPLLSLALVGLAVVRGPATFLAPTRYRRLSQQVTPYCMAFAGPWSLDLLGATSVSKSSSSSTSRRGLLSKMFQKPAPTQTHPYTHPSSSGGNSESTLVSPPSRSATKKDGQRDPDAVFGALASTYGWGVHVPALPSEPAASGKKPAGKPAAAQQDVAAPASSTPHQPLRRQLTQAQREQAIVDLSSRYGYASPLPGGRWRM
ncbi:hypothetical protein BJY52DRAFT_1225303 [Lactarius psammicola]|nr:hypothetical protein BJY52DRAFT_1225303 [Lactarius psammicola]